MARLGILLALWLAALLADHGAAAAVPAGDCDGDGVVQVAELVTLIEVGLDRRPAVDCAAGDTNGDGAITVDEILAAVAVALDAARADCTGYAAPPNQSDAGCDDVALLRPETLHPCAGGSGHLGRWTVDAAGLPAYDFTVEERCDPAAHAYSPRTHAAARSDSSDRQRPRPGGHGARLRWRRDLHARIAATSGSTTSIRGPIR